MLTSDRVVCFLPCRSGSERVPKKNIKPFGSFQHGLIEIKLKQLIDASFIDHIVLSTNDEAIISFASALGEDKLSIHHRCEELSSSQTSTDELVAHALELVGDGHILWTHVTSPFVTARIYDDLIAKYRAALTSGFDSLMSTTAIHGFLWNASGPMNYDRTMEKWPRTQTLEPVHEVNSAVFIAHANIYRTIEDRIGRHPFLYAMDKLSAMDIDWNEDFLIAEQILMNGIRVP